MQRKVAKQKKRVAECCQCWHIKYGTIALGLIEMAAVVLLLAGIIVHLSKKTNTLFCGTHFTRYVIIFLFFSFFFLYI